MDHQRLTDDVTCGLSGIQGGIGILKDNLHILANLPHLPAVELQDVLVLEEYLPLRRLFKPQEAAPQGGLSATRFAHQSQGLPLFDEKIHSVHCF